MVVIKDKRITINVRITDNFSKKLEKLSSYLKTLNSKIKDFHVSIQNLSGIVSDFEKELADLSTKADKIDELFEIEIKDAEGKESNND